MLEKVKKLSTRKVLLLQLCITTIAMLVAMVILGIIAHPYLTHCRKKTTTGITYYCNPEQVIFWLVAIVIFVIFYVFAISFLIHRELSNAEKERHVQNKKQRLFKVKRDRNFYIELLGKNSDTYQEILKLVGNTWWDADPDTQSNASFRDGINLFHNKIRVKQVYEITNKKLLVSYKEIKYAEQNLELGTDENAKLSGKAGESKETNLRDIFRDNNLTELSSNTSAGDKPKEGNPTTPESSEGNTLHLLNSSKDLCKTNEPSVPDESKMKASFQSKQEIPSREFCATNKSILFPHGCDMSEERYLFHGSLPDEVTHIVQHGFDPKREPNGPFGSVVNLYESSEKADQFCDKKFQREDSDLIMVLVRTKLGRIYENKDSPILKVPCKVQGCESSECPHALVYDSAMTGYANSFRHILVYDAARCYPHYVIMYDRTFHRHTETTQL